jgi:hypothetical protein
MGNIFIMMEIFMKEIGKMIKERVMRNVSYPNNYKRKIFRFTTA